MVSPTSRVPVILALACRCTSTMPTGKVFLLASISVTSAVFSWIILSSRTAWLETIRLHRFHSDLLSQSLIVSLQLRMDSTSAEMHSGRQDLLGHPMASWDMYQSCCSCLHKLGIFFTRLSPCNICVVWSPQQWRLWEFSELRAAENGRKHRHAMRPCSDRQLTQPKAEISCRLP